MHGFTEVPKGTTYTKIWIEVNGELVAFTILFMYGPESWGFSVVDDEQNIKSFITDRDEFDGTIKYKDIDIELFATIVNKGWNESLVLGYHY